MTLGYLVAFLAVALLLSLGFVAGIVWMERHQTSLARRVLDEADARRRANRILP